MLRLRNLNPYERHKLIINEYVLTKPGSTKLLRKDNLQGKRDIDVIRENHKFLWGNEAADTWEKQFAKKYYDKLFKEYCICDLSRYKENKVALRWRIEKEVIIGKGQFICGNKICNSNEGLRSWEVNFAYLEHGEKKNALVKLRLCPDCSTKLNYHSKKREVKRIKKKSKKKPKKRSHEKPIDLDKAASEASDDDSDNVEHVSDSEITDQIDEHERQIEREKLIEKEATNIWSNQTVDVEEPSREEEFEKYLEDLLL